MHASTGVSHDQRAHSFGKDIVHAWSPQQLDEGTAYLLEREI